MIETPSGCIAWGIVYGKPVMRYGTMAFLLRHSQDPVTHVYQELRCVAKSKKIQSVINFCHSTVLVAGKMVDVEYTTKDTKNVPHKHQARMLVVEFAAEQPEINEKPQDAWEKEDITF